MMKTRSKMFREAYPVLLLISLLMTWDLTSKGSPSSPQANLSSPAPWSLDSFKPEPVCKIDQPMRKETERACMGNTSKMSETPLFERLSRFPWEKPSDLASPKASAGWESL